jgi:small subunit ribosomal protein S1
VVKLEKAFEAQERVNGTIFNQVKGGYTVDLDGAVAFLPRSQVDIRPVRDVTPLMGVAQPFQILKMDRRRGNIVVSRRTVLEESRAEQRSELVANLEEGQVIDGVVKNSPSTVRSLISAASTACCTSPTWHGAA